jgi:hypothetical protein
MCAENPDCNCGCGDRTWFPLNSVVQVQQDGSISIQAPIGWYYIGFEQQTNQLKEVTGGGTTVSCIYKYGILFIQLNRKIVNYNL